VPENEDASVDFRSECRAGVNLSSGQSNDMKVDYCHASMKFKKSRSGAHRKRDSFSITKADLDESGSVDKAAIPPTRYEWENGSPTCVRDVRNR
jgi:hypothetical protein